MIAEILATLLVATLVLLLGLLAYARWNYGVLESLNIPVVERSLFLGSTPDLHLKVQHLEDIARYRKYGPVYGVYEGRYPHIHLCDPELIRMVFVKDFDHFRNRRDIELGDPIMNEMLDFLPYDKWRVLRQMLTPSLTASKMKLMSHRIRESALDFSQCLKDKFERSGKERITINTRETFVPSAIDMIARGLLGLKTDNPFDYQSEMCQNLENMMAEGKDPSYMYTLSFSFPILNALAPTVAAGPIEFVANFFRNAVNLRSSQNVKQNDFLDKIAEMMMKLNSTEFTELGITEPTVLGQAVAPLLAGYDAIATCSIFLSYYAATHPEVQKRLQEEVDAHVEKYGDFYYENIGELEYLHACVKETLRLVPPFIRPERTCTKDWEYNGLKIPKGTVVMIPAWAANRNPEYFHEPDAFNPDRFLDESDKAQQYGFSTFGHGPRNCIGIKFSFDSLKLNLCQLFRNFQVEVSPQTDVKYRTGVVFLLQYHPFLLDLIPRNM